MKTKKASKSDLENKRGYFRLIGLIAVLLIVLYAFKAGKQVEPIYIPEPERPDELIVEIIPVTRTETKTTQVPPPPRPRLFNSFTINEEHIEFVDTFTFEPPTFVIPPGVNPILAIKAENNVIHDFNSVQIKPEFPGGDAALLRWLAQNIKYPGIAQTNGDSGTVYVRFVVDKDGSVTNVQVLRGISPALNNEATRVVGKMPQWQPGMQNENFVRVAYTLPVKFQLQ